MSQNNSIQVIAAPHPFKTETVDFTVPEGGNIEDILSAAQTDPILGKHAHIFVNNLYVPRTLWAKTYPLADSKIHIRVVPTGGGGGKNPLRIILTIAVIAASFAFGGALGAVLRPTLGAALAGVGMALPVALPGAVGSAIILVGGMLLVNVLAPIKPPSIESQRQESPSYFLDQARNTFRPYSPVPVIFGRHRVVPPLAARPITEVVGDTNHLRLAVVWGYGPLRISDIRIGETPLSDFEDYRIQTLEGRSADNSLYLYPSDTEQELLNVTLTEVIGWVSKATGREADEISVDVTLPRGLTKFDDRGKRTENKVKIEIQYKKISDTDWLSPVFTATTADSSWVDNGVVELVGARSQPIRYGFRWSTPARAQYDVRIQRISEDETEDRSFSTVIWSALRTITDRPPINFPKGLAVTAIDIRASEQLSGSLETLNGIVEAEILDWNGRNWVPAYSRNPASVFRAILQHAARLRPAPDAEINLPVLQDFHDFCAQNDYRFDMVYDSRKSIWELLTDVCSVARSSPDWADGKWSVITDSGKQPIVQHFNELNASNFEMRRVFTPKPHGIRVSFPNESKRWKRDERIVYNDGYNSTSAENLVSLDPAGITNDRHIYKWARFHIANTVLRRSVWSFNCSFEFLIARRGSRVSVQHDVLAVGWAGGRVAGITRDGWSNQIVGIELETPILFPKSFEELDAEGSIIIVKVRTNFERNMLLLVDNKGKGPHKTLVVGVPDSNIDIPVGSLLSIGEWGSVQTEGLITNIEPESDLTAKITLVPYQEGVYRAERGRIPAFVSNIAADNDRMPALRVVSTVSDETVLQQIGLIITGTAIYVQVVPINVPSAYIEARIRPSGTKESYQPAAILRQSRNSIELIEVEDGVAYDVLLRWNQLGMVPGKWTPFTHTVGRVTQYTSVEWHHGEGAPAEGLGREGDFYLRLDGHTVYRRQKGVWIIVANLSDADAAAWYHGAGTPAKRLGSNGSFYFNTDGALIYRKIAGSWVLILDIDGTAVTNFWRAGSGVPASSLGNKNDFYFRTDNGHVYEKTDEDTWTFRHDITGPRGPAGIDGRTWHRGATAPSSALGDNGDLYLRTSNNSVYGKSGSTWTLLTSLQGSDGSRWYVGADAPANSLGDEGDWYFNSGAASIYRKTGAATWTFQITISDGSDGSIWHGGTGAPLGSTGVLGDWYFRTDNGYVYEKTGGSSWTFRRDITGPQGPHGIDGATWLQGAGAPASSLGIQHDFYLRTSNNRVYQKTGAATWTLRTDFTGAAGKAGAVWHSGAQAPAGSLGRLNDWYFRTTNATIYKKTSAATWTVQIDINDGEDGSTWYSGAGAPGSGTGVEDDWYFRTGNGFVYQKTGAVSWTFRRDITGPSGKDGTKGLRGIAGIDGKTWFTGSAAPSSALGDSGDLYLRTSNNSVYKKAGNSWSVLVDFTGADGADGATWHNGSGAPASSTGKTGDWYFATSTQVVYKKTGSSTWTAQITISDGSDGEDGSEWHSGSSFPSSGTGSVGDWYLRTSNGYVYEKTGSATWTYRTDITGPQGRPGRVPTGIPSVWVDEIKFTHSGVEVEVRAAGSKPTNDWSKHFTKTKDDYDFKVNHDGVLSGTTNKKLEITYDLYIINRTATYVHVDYERPDDPDTSDSCLSLDSLVWMADKSLELLGNVRVGSRLWTPNGPREVVALDKGTSRKPKLLTETHLVKIYTDKDEILCTGTHRFGKDYNDFVSVASRRHRRKTVTMFSQRPGAPALWRKGDAGFPGKLEPGTVLNSLSGKQVVTSVESIPGVILACTPVVGGVVAVGRSGIFADAFYDRETEFLTDPAMVQSKLEVKNGN